jgi:single-strand DNA-binding protein
MKTQNKVQLIGYVGNDPVIKVFESGSKKVRLRIATHWLVTKEDGEGTWVTTWHTAIAWNEKAELIADQFSKGSHILLEGALHYREYRDKNERLRTVTEIKAFHFLNLDR